MFKSKLHVRGTKNMDDLKRCLIYWIERGFRETKNEQMTVVFDMLGSGMSNIDMEYTKFIINTFKNYYPDSLNWILVYEMPWIMNGEWKLPPTAPKASHISNIFSSSHISNHQKAPAEKSRWTSQVHQREECGRIHRRGEYASVMGRTGQLRVLFRARITSEWRSEAWEWHAAPAGKQQRRRAGESEFNAAEGESGDLVWK